MIFNLILKNVFFRHYTTALILAWSSLIAISGSWNIYQINRDTIDKARIEARTIYQHNLAYRKWSTMHGGIYTKITQNNKSNPHFIFPLNDTQGSLGFAVVDPYQMTKQTYDLLQQQSPSLATFSRTVSLDYRDSMDPYDKPDPWERKGLLTMQKGGIDELSEIITINKAKYLRLLKPYVIEQGCLNCHVQGTYKVGAIRAGMSVAVPMEPYYHIEANSKKTVYLTHLLIWFLGCFTIIRFTSAFKKYKRTITESEEKFRIVSEFAHNFEYWVKPDNTLAFISPSCQRLTGYSREEFIERPKLLLEIIHPEDMELFKEHISDIEAPAHEGLEFRVITKKGDIRWFSHTCSPIRMNGTFLGRRSSSVDITAHKALEEELHMAKRLEYLGKFAGGIAHDFNNVLGSINTFTHLISEEIKGSNETVQDYVKYIKIAAKLGKNMTSNLLSFGKRQVITPEDTTINTIISNISDILKSLVNEDINYTIELGEPDLPVHADPHQIEQILINLCTNARDAMAKQGGTITIKTYEEDMAAPKSGAMGNIPANHYMVISVSDTGHGIAPDHIAKICEPFFTTKKASKGTGLGMSIILNIVKQHKAFLDIRSVIGGGTTFEIYFPTVTPEERPDSTITPTEPRITAPVITPSPKEVKPESVITESPLTSQQTTTQENIGTILLVDDDELIRKSLSMPLEKLGYRVLTADNGKKAISRYIDYKESIDLTILDVILPHKNGREIFEIIKRDNPEAKVIFMSGYTDNVLLDDIIEESSVTFMAKPIDFEVLQQTLKTMLT